MYGDGGVDDLAVFLCRLFVGIGYMLALVCADSGACGLRRYMGCRLKGNVSFVRTVLIFAVGTGLTFLW